MNNRHDIILLILRAFHLIAIYPALVQRSEGQSKQLPSIRRKQQPQTPDQSLPTSPFERSTTTGLYITLFPHYQNILLSQLLKQFGQ